MSYLVLARKWRPTNFEQIAGQSHVVRALANALDKKRLHHAYLFTGTRGVGKTTIARILAKSLNCEKGISSHPCGLCDVCHEIDSGRFFDLIEVDAASRTKVEDTREILNNVLYRPTKGRFKIYLIDEVHMLSGHSFNALLKTLEEPPEHVKFLLATTDPQKLPMTVLSRCLKFHLKALPAEQISDYLEDILKKENIEFESDAVFSISKSADGSMRDALSLLDHAIAFGQGIISSIEVNAMLGVVDRYYIDGIIESLINHDGASLLRVCDKLSEQPIDYSKILEELISRFHQIAITQLVPEISNKRGYFDNNIKHAEQALSREEVQLYYQIALNGRKDLSLSTDVKSGFEMTLLRMLAFSPYETALADKDHSKAIKNNELVTKVNFNSFQKDEYKPFIDKPKSETINNINKSPQHAENYEYIACSANVEINLELSNHEKKYSQKSILINQDIWPEFIENLGLSGMSYALVSNCWFVSFDGEILQLSLHENFAPLLNDKMKKKVNDAVDLYCGMHVVLMIETSKNQQDTPSKISEKIQNEKQAKILQNISQDENIKSIIDAFDVAINHDLVELK